MYSELVRGSAFDSEWCVIVRFYYFISSIEKFLNKLKVCNRPQTQQNTKKANGNGMKSESSILNIQIPITCKFTTQPI